MTTHACSCLAFWHTSPGLDAILQRKHATNIHCWPYQQFKSLPCSGASLALEFGLASLAADELLLHSVPTGQHSAEAASSTACKAGTRRASVLSL